MTCDQLLSFAEKPVHPDLISANHLIGFCKRQASHISAWVCEHACNYQPEHITEKTIAPPKPKANGLSFLLKKNDVN